MLSALVTLFFWLAWLLLAVSCVIAADRIDPHKTKRFVIYSVILLIVGAGLIFMTASGYSISTKFCLIPIFVGISIFILFDCRIHWKQKNTQIEPMDFGV